MTVVLYLCMVRTEARREYERLWRANNKDKVRLAHKEYRERKKGGIISESEKRRKMALEGVRICSTCKEEKSLTEFTRDTSGSMGFSYDCKICSRKRHRIVYENNPNKKAVRLLWRTNQYRSYWATTTLFKHRQKHEVDINHGDLVELVNHKDKCDLCGMSLDWSPHKGRLNDRSPTLDRRDNDNMIRIDNILIICHLCNRTKGNRSLTDFIEYCKNIIRLSPINILG